MKRFFHLSSVRYKLFVGVLLTSIAALLVTGFSLLAYDLHNLKSALSDDLTTQAELIGRACVPALQFDDPKTAGGNLALLQARPMIDAAAVYNSKGVIFSSYARAGTAAADFPQLPGSDGVEFDGEDISVTRRIVDNHEIVGSIYLHAHYNLYQRIRNYTGILLAVSSLALFISLLLSTWLQATVTRPIQEITKVAQQVIEKWDYSPRAHKSTDDARSAIWWTPSTACWPRSARARPSPGSLQPGAGAGGDGTQERGGRDPLRLNRELEARVQERTNKLQEINPANWRPSPIRSSHDLRAPLRAIDGFSQALLSEYGNKLDEKMQHYLNRIQSGTARMEQLIEELLNLSRISRLEIALWREVDVSALAGQVMHEIPATRAPSARWKSPSGRTSRRTPNQRLLRGGSGEPAGQRLEVHGQDRAGAHRGGHAAGGRAARDLRPRQRRGLRHGLCRQAVRRIPAPARGA